MTVRVLLRAVPLSSVSGGPLQAAVVTAGLTVLHTDCVELRKKVFGVVLKSSAAALSEKPRSESRRTPKLDTEALNPIRVCPRFRLNPPVMLKRRSDASVRKLLPYTASTSIPL